MNDVSSGLVAGRRSCPPRGRRRAALGHSRFILLEPHRRELLIDAAEVRLQHRGHAGIVHVQAVEAGAPDLPGEQDDAVLLQLRYEPLWDRSGDSHELLHLGKSVVEVHMIGQEVQELDSQRPAKYFCKHISQPCKWIDARLPIPPPPSYGRAKAVRGRGRPDAQALPEE